ncbi:DNA repair protein RadC [Bacteroidia bacterium]|nr:DNA repair protein RadC [Bacteroidia bacterium]
MQIICYDLVLTKRFYYKTMSTQEELDTFNAAFNDNHLEDAPANEWQDASQDDNMPREKLLLKGVDALSDAELLAILLRSGSRGETVVQLAQRILRSVNYDWNRLSRLSVKQLVHNFKGVGDTKAVTIVAALALDKRRQAQEVVMRGKIFTGKDTYNYFLPMMQDLDYEEFWVIFLNSTYGIIDRLKISQGGGASTTVDIQIICREALLRSASQVVACHNHPSGIAAPSALDDALTEKLHNALQTVGVRLMDHVIICGKTFYSYHSE